MDYSASDALDLIMRATKAISGARVEHFEIVRESPTNGTQIVDVAIHDELEDGPHRFAVSATTEAVDGGQLGCTGNPGPDLRTTIALVHWDDLDK